MLGHLVQRRAQLAWLTGLDAVAFLDQHLGHETGDIRRDGDDIGSHPAVACPGRVQIIVPEEEADENREHHHGQGDDETEGP